MKATRLWLTTIAALLFSHTASAHNFEVEGIYYNITSATDLTVSVTCRGSSYDSYSNEYTGEVTIPAKVNYNSNTYSVTSIGYGAFYGCSNLTTITIPESMKNIGGYAFYGCSSLTTVTIPEGVKSIGDNAFDLCRSLIAIAIPSSVTSIGAYAFYKCSNLTTVTIPEGVKSIGAYAFSGCSSLTTITFPSSVTSIGASAFSGCSSFTAITIPEKVASIGTKTFELCSSLSYITLSEELTTIENSAFSGCRNLSSITIPATVTSIGYNAFDNCSSLRSITFKDGPSLLSIGCKSNSSGGLFDDCPLESIYLGRDIKCDATYYGSVCAPFRENASLLALSIGECVTCIYESFNSCCNLSSITFSENSKLASIGVGTFEYCSSLTSITIPESVTSIGSSAFRGCSALTNLTIGSSVSSIGEYAFAGCSDIENIYALNPKAITYDESVFSTDAYNNAILYVPTDRAFAYEKATPWSKFQIEPMKKFTVTYMVDGKAYETKEVEYASEITLIDEPVKEGYTFTGWSEAPKTMPAEDVVINGSFIANKYLVTFKIGDEVIDANTLEYGTAIVAPEAPEKEGHTFNGWGEVAETVPANDVVYEGSYSVNSYKLTYIIEGEIFNESMVVYGTIIELIEGPSKVGYAFNGWSKVPETMPANDVVTYGTYTKLFVETMVINDSDSRFSMDNDTECGTITYTRAFNNTNWQALYVPFEIPYEAISEDFEVAYIYDARQYDRDNDGAKDETFIEAFKISEGILEANYPYIIRAKEIGEKSITVTDATLYATDENSIDCSSVFDTYTFTGTYSSLSSDELDGCYALSGGIWQPVLEGTSLGAFRFYLKIDSRHGNATPPQAIKMRIVDEDGNTSTEKLELKTQNSEQIFDLQGRRVESPTKGIYIINGKKVVIK